MWLITVNIAQRCSNTRTDPQNDDAKHSGKLHDLCRITELVQRELRSCESRLTNFANPVRNPPQNAQDRLQTFNDSSLTCPELCLTWSRRAVWRGGGLSKTQPQSVSNERKARESAALSTGIIYQ